MILKSPQKNTSNITKLALWISYIYGNVKVHICKKYNYLGIDLEYSAPGQVQVYMVNHLKIIL